MRALPYFVLDATHGIAEFILALHHARQLQVWSIQFNNPKAVSTLPTGYMPCVIWPGETHGSPLFQQIPPCMCRMTTHIMFDWCVHHRRIHLFALARSLRRTPFLDRVHKRSSCLGCTHPPTDHYLRRSGALWRPTTTMDDSTSVSAFRVGV